MGRFVDVGELVRTAPDVVFSHEIHTESLAPITDRLGIPVVSLACSEGPFQIAKAAQLMAEIFGSPRAHDRAEQYADYVRDEVSEVISRGRSIAEDDRPSVYYAAGAALETEGAGSIVTRWIYDAGGRNVAADVPSTGTSSFPVVERETLIGWDPEVIVTRTVDERRELISDRRFRRLRAVANGRVYASPSGVTFWAVRGPEAAIMPFWAARLFHPGPFDDIDVRRIATTFYRRFYGKAVSRRLLAGILDPA
jgi:iron complex transport system substrate-binding protein